MAKTQILEYTVYLRDATVVSAAQKEIANAGTAGSPPVPYIILPLGGKAIQYSPYGASIEYDKRMGGDGLPPLPMIEVGQRPPTDGPGYIMSGWFTSTNSFPRTERSFQKKDGWWIFGSTTTFYWAGRIALAPGAPATVGTPANLIPSVGISPRLVLHGFEQFLSGEMGAFAGLGAYQARTTPGASRTGDGWAARSMSLTTGRGWTTYDLTALRPAVTDARDAWSRVYIRPLKWPATGTQTFFHASDTSVWFPGFDLGVTATGQIVLFKNSGFPSGTQTVLATVGQTVLGQWHRLDVLLHAQHRTLSCDVRLNGAAVASGSFDDANFDVPTRAWAKFALGQGAVLAAPQTDLEMDLDDWIVARAPVTQALSTVAWSSAVSYAIGTIVRHNGFTYVATAASTNQAPAGVTTAYWTLVADPTDLSMGSHLVRVAPDAFGSSHNPSWVGDVRLLQRRVQAPDNGAQRLTCTVAGALAEVTLPLATAIQLHPHSLGIVAWRVVVHSKRGGTQSGTLGYQIGGDPPVMTALVENTTPNYEAMTGTVTTGAPLAPGTAMTLRYANANDPSASTALDALCAVVELQGQFGQEDLPPAATPLAFPRTTPVQLTQHPSMPWAQDALPMGPVLLVGGTYVGNGTGQDLLFKLPVTWLLIRAVVSTGPVTRWWPSLLAPQSEYSGVLSSSNVAMHHVRDHTFVPASPTADQQVQVKVQLGGSDQVNVAGVTYQYCALFDPAGRFARAAATSAREPVDIDLPGVPRTWVLDDPTFLAEGAVHFTETFTVPFGAPLCWKTPGHSAAAVSTFSNTEGSAAIPDALTFGTGTITIGAGLVSSGDHIENLGFLLFRRNDGNPGSDRVLFTGSYVGDAAASRTITVGTTGTRPLYACVGAETGGSQYHRDPSHTTTTSSRATGGTAVVTTAITGGGIDSFTVGPLLNATGVTYHYWGLYGGVTACENGWSCNGEFVPVPTDSAKPPDWDEPTVVDPPGGPGPGPGPGPDEPTDPGDPGSDIDPDCVQASTRIVNQALQEIGITKEIVTLGADVAGNWIDQSQEAFAARMIYRTLVDSVLRDDEWAFTREYATLTVLAGTADAPVNPDWTYSYTLPSDCLRVKRICDPALRRRYTVQPIPFDRRSTNLGQTDLLLCNEPGGGQLPLPKTGEPITLTIEYAKRILCPARVTDSQFRECLVFRLAAGLAKALARDSKDADRCLRNYAMALPKALTQHANDSEPQRPVDGPPDWITGR